MPSYVPKRALDLAQRMIRNARFADQEVWNRVCQDASDMIWMAAPWRWTLGRLDPVELVARVHEYPISLPSDFEFLVSASLVGRSGDEVQRLVIVPYIPYVESLVDQPRRVAVDQERSVVIVGPSPPDSGSILSLWYKKSPPTVNPNTPGSLVMPDAWAWVYEMAVLYYAYLYADDQRAGSAEYTAGGAWRYSGFRAVLEAAMAQMREREILPMPEPTAEYPVGPAQVRRR